MHKIENKAAVPPDSVPSAPIILYGPDGQVVDVPKEGSLGLLALGYVGLMLWRQKRKSLQEADIR